MSVSGIEASGDLQAPLAQPCSFLLAAMRRDEVFATLMGWPFNA